MMRFCRFCSSPPCPNWPWQPCGWQGLARLIAAGAAIAILGGCAGIMTSGNTFQQGCGTLNDGG